MTKTGDLGRTNRLNPRLNPLRIFIGCGLFVVGWFVLGTSNAQAATTDRGVSASERAITGSPAVEYQNPSYTSRGGAVPATAGTAGGADASVDAGFIGGDEARVEGVGPTTFWPGRESGARTEDMSAHIGHVRASEVDRSSQNMSNVHTPEYECMTMKEDTSLDLPGFGGMLAQSWAHARCWDGHVGRVVQDAITAAGGSAPSVWQAFSSARQVGEPALGVMGGLIQSVSSPAERVPEIEPIWFEIESPRTVTGHLPSTVTRSETAAPFSLPPVSSFSSPSRSGTEPRSTGSSESPTKTTPAPNSIPEQSPEPIGVLYAAGDRTAPDRGQDVIPGDVSPRTDAAPAATDVQPTGRKSIANERAQRPGASPG